MSVSLYPLCFKEILRDYGFGDRWIVEAYQKSGFPEDHRVAETWEVCDRPGESSEVVSGPLTGETLHTLIDSYGEALLGTEVVTRCGPRFPLLIKFLDASNPLGEQAHHTDEQAIEHGLADPGKTEAWYMLKVRKGAKVRCGNKAGVTADAVRKAMLSGTVKDLMRPYDVTPGDAFLLYSGTMHCGDGGTLFYEVMQNSDVYISLRAPDPSLPAKEREAIVRQTVDMLHIEPDLDTKTEPVVLGGGANRRTFVYACRHFALERLDLMAPAMINCDGRRFYVVSLIEGACTVVHGDRHERLLPGQTIFLPASIGYVTLIPTEPCALLKTYVPDLARDVVKPLRAMGISDSGIAALGGTTVLNDLLPLLEGRQGE